MTGRTAPSEDAERIRDQAAAWLARLERGPTLRQRRALDRWLAADPRHAAAYRRISAQFAGARRLRSSTSYVDRPPMVRRRSPAVLAAAACVVLGICLLAFIGFRATFPQASRDAVVDAGADRSGSGARATAARRFEAPTGIIRSFGLRDGSIVTLDADSAVDVAFASDARVLTLRRGRARFAVAHDGRPFTVLAGGGSVVARGTVFDVAIDPAGRVRVALWRGAVDVSPRGRPSGGTASPVRRLMAGEGLDYGAGRLSN